MALGDYILCCKCEVKLVYDGDSSQREWWEERFGKPPQIECPNCKPKREWQGLTDDEKSEIYHNQKFVVGFYSPAKFADAIEAKLKEKNNG